MSYIENTFYTKVLLIRFFMQKEKEDKVLSISILNNKVIETIEQIYFSTLKNKKMLMDIGIYERDVDKIIKVIGDDFDDTVELKSRLSANFNKLKNISSVSKYVI